MADKILSLTKDNVVVGVLELLNKASFVEYYTDIGSKTLLTGSWRNACIPKTYNPASKTNEWQPDPKTNDVVMSENTLLFTKDNSTFYRPVSHRQGLIIEGRGGNSIRYRFLGVSAGTTVLIKGKKQNSIQIAGSFGGGDWYPMNNNWASVRGEAGCKLVSNGDQAWHDEFISQCFNRVQEDSGDVKTRNSNEINEFNVFINPSFETSHCKVEFHSGQYFLFNKEEDHGHSESSKSWVKDFLSGFWKTVVRWVAKIVLIPVYEQRTSDYANGPYIDRAGAAEYGQWHRCICAMTYWDTSCKPAVKYDAGYDDSRVNTADATVEADCLKVHEGVFTNTYYRGTTKFFDLEPRGPNKP